MIQGFGDGSLVIETDGILQMVLVGDEPNLEHIIIRYRDEQRVDVYRRRDEAAYLELVEWMRTRKPEGCEHEWGRWSDAYQFNAATVFNQARQCVLCNLLETREVLGYSFKVVLQ